MRYTRQDKYEDQMVMVEELRRKAYRKLYRELAMIDAAVDLHNQDADLIGPLQYEPYAPGQMTRQHVQTPLRGASQEAVDAWHREHEMD